MEETQRRKGAATARGGRRLIASWAAALALLWAGNAQALGGHPDVAAFIDEVVVSHGLDRAELEALFARVQYRDQVVEAMQRPAERLPWHRYRGLFISDRQAEAGVRYWRAQRQWLDRAEQEYGVPAEVIVAIIGIETRFGGVLGRHPVIDSLATLMVGYPRRSDFFRSELEQFLLLSREEGWDPMEIRGSYAGAMGVPQFISSSYRQYAVDFNGDGVRDLIGSHADAIGSVGNYLRVHGWERGQPIATPVSLAVGTDPATLLAPRFRAETPVAELREGGVRVAADVPAGLRAGLFELETTSGREYHLGFTNFYAITRYNHSVLYAMAVTELAREIRRRYPDG